MPATRADPNQLELALLNLTLNARDAMADGGKLTIETADVELDTARVENGVAAAPGSYVVLTVADTGHGMDEATQKRIFEPFFTTKPMGQGTGLGLATVYGIVKQSDGSIWVESEVGHGTTFTVYLPGTDEVEEAVRPPPIQASALGGAETVLLVEDAARVREVVREILEINGYRILEAPHGAAALEISQRHEGPIHLMVTDVVMPQMSGRELAEQL